MAKRYPIPSFTFSSSGAPPHSTDTWVKEYFENTFDLENQGTAWKRFEDTFFPIQSLTVGIRKVDAEGRLVRPARYPLATPLEMAAFNVLIKGDLSINGHAIPTGEVYFLDYRKPFTLATTQGYTEYSLYIPDLALPHLHSLSPYHSRPLPGEMPTLLAHFIQAIATNIASFDHGDAPKTGKMIREMMKVCTEKLQLRTPPPSIMTDWRYKTELELVECARNYIDDHIHDHTLSANVLAKDINVPLRQLNQLFKNCYGGLSKYIKARRLKLAHLEIEQSSTQIKKIAYDLNFTNTASFSRTFKAEFGYTPVQAYEISPTLPMRARFIQIIDRPLIK